MLEPAASKVADSTASDHSGAPPESLVEAEQPAAGQGALVDHKREWATLAVQLAAATPASFHRAIAGQAVALGRLAQASTDPGFGWSVDRESAHMLRCFTPVSPSLLLSQMPPPRARRRRAAVSWYYTLIQLFGHGTGVQAWPDDGGVRQLAERRDNANREYQLARAAYERGDFVTAEPLFRKALEFAPEFPEPHFALAQLMQRLGRNEEAQHFMAQVLRPDGGTTTC